MTNTQNSVLKTCFFISFIIFCLGLKAQVKWVNADVEFAGLPKGFHVYKTNDSLDGKPFVAYYAITDIKNKKLHFNTDTTYKRRLTPAQFFKKNENPLLVVNATFFSFATNQNLNLVINDGRILSYNIHSILLKGKDTFMYKHTFGSAIGISKKRKADIAWTYTDSLKNTSYAFQYVKAAIQDSASILSFEKAKLYSSDKVYANIMGIRSHESTLKKWKMKTAIGGGPVLVQNGKIQITNNEELKFTGKAINDLHPRTLMGYTKDSKLIVMVIEGRNPGVADGASLVQAAKLMVELGCWEALNLDGGGSSCMLINGKETIKPSDKGLQRAIPAVFIISN